MSAIDDKISELNIKFGAMYLGDSTTPELSCSDGSGRFRSFKNATVFWRRDLGAFVVHGAIRDKYLQIGSEKSVVGYPITDETQTPDKIGYYNHFQNGSIYWTQTTGAHEIHGAIRGKWSDLGWERSLLGYPTTDESATPDGVGRFNHFQGGSVYWKPTIGAHEVHGEIRTHWASQGWERNAAFGYPISDEMLTQHGDISNPTLHNRFSDFENGVIFWDSQSGRIDEVWPIGLVSKSADDVVEQVRDSVHDRMPQDGTVDIVDAALAGVTDYTQVGGTVHNRQIQVRLELKVHPPWPFADVDVTLNLWIAVELDRATNQVINSLQRYQFDLSSWASGKIHDQLKQALDAALGSGSKTDLSKYPVLSVKVMPDGSVKIY